MSGRDVVDEIDRLVDEQMAGGEDHRAMTAYEATEERCPHCGRRWHGLVVTEKVAEMYRRGVYDPDYSIKNDTSQVLCRGSDFIGPMPAGAQAIPFVDSISGVSIGPGLLQVPGPAPSRITGMEVVQNEDGSHSVRLQTSDGDVMTMDMPGAPESVTVYDGNWNQIAQHRRHVHVTVGDPPKRRAWSLRRRSTWWYAAAIVLWVVGLPTPPSWMLWLLPGQLACVAAALYCAWRNR